MANPEKSLVDRGLVYLRSQWRSKRMYLGEQLALRALLIIVQNFVYMKQYQKVLVNYAVLVGRYFLFLPPRLCNT